jgi:A/G-specific adenine glycosylase
MELPGIGAYTAAAVASIACGIAAPVLDGNVERVMARWLGLAGDVKRTAARARLLAAAAEFLVADRSGDSNQALMELGAVICLPRRPKCLLCPLQGACVAAAEGQPEAYPTRRPRRSREVVRLIVAVAEHAGRVLMFQRPAESAVLAGTWELPWVEEGEGEVRSAGVRLAAKYGVAGAAAEWRLGAELARVRHGITFRDFEVSVRPARLDLDNVAEAGGESRCGWFDPAQVRGLPTSSLVGKVLRAVAAAAPGGAEGFRNRGRPASRLPSRRRG